MRPRAGSGAPPTGNGAADRLTPPTTPAGEDTAGGATPIWLGATPTGTQLEHLTLERFHQAIDRLQTDTVPESYWRKVIESRWAGPPDGPSSRPTQETPDDHDQHRP